MYISSDQFLLSFLNLSSAISEVSLLMPLLLSLEPSYPSQSCLGQVSLLDLQLQPLPLNLDIAGSGFFSNPAAFYSVEGTCHLK